MSSSNGKSFTGMTIIVLALFGIGGAVLDHLRGGSEHVEVATSGRGNGLPGASGALEPVSKAPMSKSGRSGPDMSRSGQSMPTGQAGAEFIPGFEVVNLAKDGTGTVAGNAVPGTGIELNLDGKIVTTGKVGQDGGFSLELKKPLAVGRHLIKLQAAASGGAAPIPSNQSIEVKIRKGDDVVVTFLEPGNPPRILQGIDDQLNEGARSKQDQKAREDAASAIASPGTVGDRASQTPAGLQQGAGQSSDDKKTRANSKPVSQDLAIREKKFIAIDAKSGEIHIAGMAPAGSTVRFLLDGNNIGKALADAGGNWSLKLKHQLASGAHWLVVEQFDKGGEVIAKVQEAFDRTMQQGAKPKEKSSLDALAMIKKAMSGNQKAVEPLTNNQAGDARDDTGVKAGSNEKLEKMSPSQKTSGDKAAKDPSLWNKIAGIFKLDPTKKKTGGTSSLDPSSPAGQGRPGDLKAAEVGNFAFETVSYKKSAKGGMLEFTGHAAPGSHIELFEGERKLGKVVADKRGVWSYVKTGSVSSGAHLFRALHVLKSGRITSEARMQYDHITPVEHAKMNRQAEGGGATKQKREGSHASGMRTDMSGKKRLDQRTASIMSNGSGDELQADGRKPQAATSTSKTGSLPYSKVSKTGSSKTIRTGRKKRSTYRRSVRTNRRRHKVRQFNRARRNKHLATKSSSRRKMMRRARLSKKNRARYLKKRMLYPRSKRTPTNVRVRKGATLWGYSEHYYGSGRQYRRIYRANRHKLRGPGRIFAGQRISVPRKNSGSHLRKER